MFHREACKEFRKLEAKGWTNHCNANMCLQCEQIISFHSIISRIKCLKPQKLNEFWFSVLIRNGLQYVILQGDMREDETKVGYEGFIGMRAKH